MSKKIIFIPLCLASLWTLFFYYNFGLPLLPLDGSGDIAGWEATGHYFKQNLKLLPFPNMSFETNDHFYPGGIPAVYQSWAFERDYWYAAFSSLFGQGPWLQMYFLLSQIIVSVGLFLLLSYRLKAVPAGLLGFFGSFGNIYLFVKYPSHYGLSVAHWSLLALVADVLICQDVARRKCPHVLLLLARGMLLVASFGLELGYIVGINLTSFVLSAVYIFITLLQKRKDLQELSLKQVKKALSLQVHRSKVASGLLAFATVIFSVLYLPILAELFVSVKKIEVPNINGAIWFAEPVRFLFPFIEPYYSNLARQVGDSPEGFPAGSMGWFFLFGFIITMVYAFKTRAYGIIPVMLLFLTFVFYKPYKGSWLQWMPWFTYARVGSRFTITYPIIVVSLATLIPMLQKGVSFKWKKGNVAILATLGLLAFLEYPFYKQYLTRPLVKPSMPAGFFSYMEELKQRPGEAVLDWPFCFKGGNGIGSCEFNNLESIWANKKYHDKKVLGTYFARLPAQFHDFYRQYGLQELLTKQRKGCLSERELTYLKLFYSYHDFAALQLYADQVSACVEGFKQVFGEPAKVVSFPHVGRVMVFERLDGLSDYASGKVEAGTLKQHVNALEVLPRIQNVLKAEEIIYVPEPWYPLYITLKTELFKDMAFEILPYESLTTTPIKQGALVIASPHNVASFRRIFKFDEFGFYQKNSQKFEVAFDFSSPQSKIDFDKTLSHEIKSKDVWVHPLPEKQAVMKPQITLPLSDYFLQFGFGLDNPKGKIRFLIKDGDSLLFSAELHEVIKVENLILSLPSETNVSNLTFHIDPMGPNLYDWSYWVRPRLLKKVSQL